MLHVLVDWIVSWANSPYGGLALFGLAFVESIFLPIPPDTLLIALSLAVPSRALLFAAVATLASLMGGTTGYYIGNKGGRPLVVRRFGEQKVAVAQRLYHKYDVWALAIAGFTPIPYQVFALSAGVLQIEIKRFLFASLIGRAGRFFLVASLIYAFGDMIQYYLARYFGVAALAFVFLLIGGYLVVNLASKRLRAPQPVSSDD